MACFAATLTVNAGAVPSMCFLADHVSGLHVWRHSLRIVNRRFLGSRFLRAAAPRSNDKTSALIMPTHFMVVAPTSDLSLWPLGLRVSLQLFLRLRLGPLHHELPQGTAGLRVGPPPYPTGEPEL
jgi:hypothetical protein